MKFSQRTHLLLFGILIIATASSLVYYLSTNYKTRHHSKHISKQNVQEDPSSVMLPGNEVDDFPSALLIIDSYQIEEVTRTTLSFITKLLEHNINVFFIEPCVLWKTITESDQQQLDKRASVPQFATSCYPIQASGPAFMTLGIKESDSISMGSPLMKALLVKEGYEVEEFWDPKTGRMSHHLARKEGQIIHTVTFFKRNTFLVTHELRNPPFGVSVKELRFGATKQAFEPIKLTYNNINNAKVILPQQRAQLLFEIPHSQFLECRHDLAAKYDVKYALKDVALTQLQETIKVMRQITYKVQMPIWLDGGSLIGWARHCGAIPYELDADFASWGHLHGKDYDLAEQIVKAVQPPWYFIETFGLPWSGYELRLYHTQLDWQVDFFFTTQDEEDSTQSYLGYHTFPGVYFIKLYYNSSVFSTVCSGEILGHKIMIPCHYDELLTEEYGHEWVTPDENHFLKYQPRQHKTYWPEEEGFYAYQCLGRNQFNLRKFDYAKYKYTTDREKKPKKLNEAFGNVINEYKSVCTRLRWNRTW